MFSLARKPHFCETVVSGSLFSVVHSILVFVFIFLQQGKILRWQGQDCRFDL